MTILSSGRFATLSLVGLMTAWSAWAQSTPKGWAGTWQGTLLMPGGGKAVTVIAELGPFPETDQTSARLRKTFVPPGGAPYNPETHSIEAV